MPAWTLVFGFRHVDGVPRCPCADPGNYLAMEESSDDPLAFRMRCWCGRTIKGTFDDRDERDAFLRKNGVVV